jgi:hypothetical protein
LLDLLFLPHVNLRLGRQLFSLGAVTVLIVGFIWDLEED